MKYMNKFLFIAIMALGAQTFADGIWFISPQPGQAIGETMTIQIQPPYHKTDVNVWIKNEDGIEMMVWRGTLTAANKYSATVNTSQFKPGRYEVKAEYYVGGDDIDGDVEVWIGNPNIPAGGEYFPQQ
ncbi:MAG: hypothetical protein ACRCVW_04010 [Brevinema sp.]